VGLQTQLEVFDKLCAASREINDPATAFRDIDFLLDTAHRLKRPVYIELPRDMVAVVPDQIRPYHATKARSDQSALAEAVTGVLARPEPQRRFCARRRAEHFSWPHSAAGMLAALGG
jgi:indolepyruvate decarboxylase